MQVAEQSFDFAKQSEENAKSTARAFYALAQFIADMEDFDIKSQLERVIKLCMVYLQDAAIHNEIKYEVLGTLSSTIIAANEIIKKYLGFVIHSRAARDSI